MYGDLIQRFLYEEMPFFNVSGNVRFEAISKAIFGSKQLRSGPMPVPEVQVGIRQVIRTAMESHEPIKFFVPWGSRKQDGGPFDVLDFMAIKQLSCLQQTLANYGQMARFAFRIESLTDQFLFGADGIDNYIPEFTKAVNQMITNSEYFFENEFVDPRAFLDDADRFLDVFLGYLRGRFPISRLEEIGWKGTIPKEQRDYYLKAYAQFGYADPLFELAKYFAATMSRVKNNATAIPNGDVIHISFTNPVPGNPISRHRVYYRSIPERYTHFHRPPWIGKGYLVINGEEGECTPKVLNEPMDLINCQTVIDGINIQTNYVLES